MKTIFFANCTTLDEVKKRYKELAMKHHPDRGGDTATMQGINLEYEKLIKSGCFEFKTEEEQEENLIYPDIISKLVVLDDIIIEIVFRWIWVSGDTKKHRNQLKEIGLLYAPKKQMWYFRPASWSKVFNRSKPMEMEEIRARYGSEFVNKNDYRNKKAEEKTLKPAS
jgi:hypothetical protein